MTTSPKPAQLELLVLPPVLPTPKLPPDNRIEASALLPEPQNISPRQTIKTCELLSTLFNVNVSLVVQLVPE